MSTDEHRNREIIRRIYEASFAGDANALPSVMHEDFEERVPPILPWGGVHRGPVAFKKVLPMVAAAMDFRSIRLVSLAADGDRVAALLSGQSTSGKDLSIAEHWTLRDGKVSSLMVFYHDTTPLMPTVESDGR
jgi:ketosteroid isomerase-like protein